MNHDTIQIDVPKSALVAAFLEKIGRGNGTLIESALQVTRPDLPAIGAQIHGGIFAGLTLHDNTPYLLVLLPGDESLKWKDAVAWAEKQGGQLPSRIDQLVLFKSLPNEFQKAWYWSGEEYARLGAYAWTQHFGFGYQYGVHKDLETRCRAVRRVSVLPKIESIGKQAYGWRDSFAPA